MNTNDNCGMATFKWLATLLSFAISLPGYFDDKSKIAFILTVCVFVFGKFVENIEGIVQHKTLFHTWFCIIGSFLGALAISLCFYYFAAISNVTQIVETVTTEIEELNEMEIIEELNEMEIIEELNEMEIIEETKADVEKERVKNTSVKLISDADMSKYPLFQGESYYGILFLILVYFIIQETIFWGCEFCKYINTKKKVLLCIKKTNDLLDISVE